MFELDDNWKLYKTLDGAYQGYFEEGKNPEGWILFDTYYVSSNEFLDFFCLVDASILLAASITYNHFTNLSKRLNLCVEFEDLTISEIDAIGWVVAAIEDDKNKFIDSYGDEYTDWQHFSDVINVFAYATDFVVTIGDNVNEELIQQISKSLGLDNIEDINDYDLNDISLDGLEELKKQFYNSQ